MAHVDDPDEHWSDAPETLDDDQSGGGAQMDIEEDTGSPEDDLTVRDPLKITADREKPDPAAPILESTVAEPLPGVNELPPDPSASVHSLPVVHVTEPTSPGRRPSTARSPQGSESIASGLPPPSPARTQMSTESSVTSSERRHRPRSAIDARSSNRLSGFFSNLIHRRDHPPNNASRSTVREEPSQPSSPLPPASSSTAPRSRSPSPAPTRPSTPPPQLPPPTLQELGLSLSVLTSDLSPAHFSTPPSSGAFLAPHYLLLCHSQGLDVLPLISPPAPQPYALVRRVSFKSVVVMEQRGVLVAIAGRRDGVRVYALEEVKKAVEWRVDVEIRRERERTRRDEAKKASSSIDSTSLVGRDSSDRKSSKARLSTPPSSLNTQAKGKLTRKSSASSQPALIPRTPTPKKPKPPSQQTIPIPPMPPMPTEEQAGRPPPYTVGSTRLRSQTSVVSLHHARPRAGSVSDVLAGTPAIRRNTESDAHGVRHDDSKADDWVESRGSDDEAIDIVAAGPSGSQALDERTSARATTQPPSRSPTVRAEPSARPRAQSTRRNRPANLDLSMSTSNDASIIPPEPSPTPTLLTLRQALSHSPPTAVSRGSPPEPTPDEPDTPRENDEDEDEGGGAQLTLVQALLESRLPDLPPVGTRRPQQPLLLTASHPVVGADDELPASPRSSEAHSIPSSVDPVGRRRRRRWSVNLFSGSSMASQPSIETRQLADSTGATLIMTGAPTPASVREREHVGSPLVRSHSSRSRQASLPAPVPPRPSTSNNARSTLHAEVPPTLGLAASPTSMTSSHSRFFSRMISNAFSSRRSEDQPQTLILRNSNETDGLRSAGPNGVPHTTPPKLEYVKLPGTKGALMVKAVETAKKSFLAILCGENGEKVELFAGTYRTALGLSRTFILPDSPRSLELQLQGDDLVEVFLVFSQNVFGLEPATVRVREVRIGRAERRAARRRAREMRTGDTTTTDTDPPNNADEDTNVNVSIGVSVTTASDLLAPGQAHPAEGPQPSPAPATIAASPEALQTGEEVVNPSSSVAPHAEELVALATAQMGPYTTFQQLSFAPNFPLASIADEYIIPPTYPSFLDYRSEHEPEVNGSSNIDLAQIQFSPPGLPVPAPSPPSKWFYRDPKGVIHGPWKASLMQAWYKDGLLPPDLPVRMEEETEYMLLKDLRLQSVDPTHPFRSPPPPLHPEPLSVLQENAKPLLSPISLLAQPRHFGPPALFFSSRGGHSTTIVDARGRSVLKGRFMWSTDDNDETKSVFVRMGDVKRLEAFDVKDRAVLVAMRQGGLEAVDLGDALLRPADESRTILPQFSPPSSNINRRGPFVWRIGTPVSASPTSSTTLAAKSNRGHNITKKLSTGAGKSPGRTEFSMGGDTDYDNHDEVLFLGRKDNEIYLCERIAGSFRLLRLSPHAP